MDFIFIGYYNDLWSTYDMILSGKILWVDRYIELLGLWKLKSLGFEFWGKKNENENEVERVTAASWLLFFPTFSLLLNILNLFVTNQQIINIELEYKYFVSCWQRNFVS